MTVHAPQQAASRPPSPGDLKYEWLPDTPRCAGDRPLSAAHRHQLDRGRPQRPLAGGAADVGAGEAPQSVGDVPLY